MDKAKRIRTFLAAVFCLVALSIFACASASDSGTWSNLNWSISDAGLLSISGNGPMPDCSSSTETPWSGYYNDITRIEISSGITSIGSHTLSSRNTINIIIPVTVTSIGDYAFYGCASLSYIEIPQSVTEIGESAFRFCSSLRSIVIPDGITEIKENTFNYCIGLRSISLPGSVQRIGNSAFQDCSSLTSVQLPGGLVSIGEDAFSGSGIITIQFPESVETIGSEAFLNCQQLENIVWPSNIVSIGDSTFRNCLSLQNVTFSNSVQRFGVAAFSECNSLTDVYYAGSVSDRENIQISERNNPLLNANWHYAYGDIPIDSAHFPEATFRRHVSEEFDKNQDGILSSAERNTAKYFIHDEEWEYRLYSLCGIEYFPNLEWLVCPWNMITEVDLSYNTKLKTIAIEYNPLDELDVSSCMYLVETCANAERIQGIEAEEGIDFIGPLEVDKRTNVIAGNKVFPARASSPATITKAPVAKMLIYNGEMQELVTAGEAENGQCLYGTDNPAFGFYSEIPTAKDVGEYTVYYRAYGDETHYDADSVAIIARIFPAETVSYGVCGDNLTWYLTADGTLTISGTGAMYGYYGSEKPWGTDITKVIIEDGVESIGSSAFWGCSLLKSVEIADSVTSIGDAAFIHCDKLQSIVIPSKVKYIYQSTFQECSKLTSVILPEGLVSIGKEAFEMCYKLDNVIIPESVEHLGLGAFIACTSLSEINIPASVETIDADALSGCDKLTEINVDSDNPNYASINGVLFNKDKTELITCPGGLAGIYRIPNGVTSIGSNAFWCNKGLTEVIFSDSVTTVGRYAFYSSNIESVSLSSGMRIIGHGCFNNCEKLSNVVIPNGITILGTDCFAGCSLLTNVVLPESVTDIGTDAFYRCGRLESITIPASVTDIGTYAFYDCSVLANIYYTGSKREWKAITIDENNDSLLAAEIHYLGQPVFGEVTFTLPTGIQVVGPEAFSSISASVVYIPDGLLRIEGLAFAANSKLEQIRIPDSVTYIDNTAFDQCERVYIFGTEGSTASEFADAHDNCIFVEEE